MNKILATAAGLAAFTAALHTFGGTPEIEAPLLQAPLPQEISLLLYTCWHLVTAALTLSAIGLFISAKPKHTVQSHYMALFISFMWIAFGLVFIVVDITYSGLPMLLKLPQWILLIPIGVLGLWGCARLRMSES
ncbi:hypothetical protein GCM10011613_26830 [Cellvibrio zantedeschiae]|uniref:DUF423 domain-containing protein n=1 Tax=Cellvibrio zantedeschiae TaxID=1237077 RepID=A0ABQ3B8S4_9GAMM|nr:hypothetical protein [Cellvibrio zantedeschiae]GGY80437.1 hypothetical protein GCM10011613_26830 [Cellvibrio zantedeschiae]